MGGSKIRGATERGDGHRWKRAAPRHVNNHGAPVSGPEKAVYSEETYSSNLTLRSSFSFLLNSTSSRSRLTQFCEP